MTYRLEYSSLAAKKIEKLTSVERLRVLKGLEQLKTNPHPRGSRKLSGMENLYRIRIGDFRAVYMIFDADAAVVVSRVGHRKDVYKNL